MGKIKVWYRSVPIWLAIFLFAAGALLTASWVSDQVTNAAYRLIGQIQVSYLQVVPSDELVATGEYQYHITTGGKLTSATTWRVSMTEMSEEDQGRYDLYRAIVHIGPLLIYSILLLAAALLFYFSKLKRPLNLLQTASEKIAENQLDFSLDYAGRDEMAQLCTAFEKMRSALDENNLRMLRMIDEQQQLNDAYTHDLRTPIAILKGYTDLLVKYLPTGQLTREEVVETAGTMSAHVARLEQFVGSMNTAQRIVDLTVQRREVPAETFAASLRETAQLLCGSRGLSCQVDPPGEGGTLNIDPAAVTQVFENLLGNALRFARCRITVRLERQGQTLSLQVTDDGKGFSGKELLTAAKPYSSGQQDRDSYHFGLGLYLCRTLCEKHGGSLLLANAPEGGAQVTAVFAM